MKSLSAWQLQLSSQDLEEVKFERFFSLYVFHWLLNLLLPAMKMKSNDIFHVKDWIICGDRNSAMFLQPDLMSSVFFFPFSSFTFPCQAKDKKEKILKLFFYVNEKQTMCPCWKGFLFWNYRHPKESPELIPISEFPSKLTQKMFCF